MIHKNAWLGLIISLPTSNATVRMRIWRALKGLGCGILRDGVYLLPDSEAAHHSLSQQAHEVIQSGGTAYVVQLHAGEQAQDMLFRTLFDRTADYARLKQDIDALHHSLPGQELVASKRALQRLSRDFAGLGEIDFFPGAAKDQTATSLASTTAAFAAIANPDEPHPGNGKIKKLPRDDYRKRIWATRKRMWVDRMASAWLILRFIDPAAKFKWLNTPRECPKHVLGFDFDGATFTHTGSLVTFEVLLASFDLEPDPALQRLATVVHYLDVGGIPVAEAPGLELVLKGMRERCGDDDALLAEATKFFDDLYQTYTTEHIN